MKKNVTVDTKRMRIMIGVLGYDSYNCSIDKYTDWNTGKYMEVEDKRCVYGYYTKGE